MSLLDDLPTTKAAMALAIATHMEDQFQIPEGTPEADVDAIKANWDKLADAVSQLLQPTMQHIIDHGGVGGGGGPTRVTLAASVVAPAGITYSGGANAPPESASCTWRSLLSKIGTGTAYARLWDMTASVEVATVSSTNAAAEIKDATVAITVDHIYEVLVWITGTGQTDVAVLGSSQLIIG